MIQRFKIHIVTFVCCLLLFVIVISSGDRAARIVLSSYYLILAYGLFITLLVAKIVCLSRYFVKKPTLLSWCNKHEIALSVVIGFSLMIIIEESHEVRTYYNLAAGLGFGLLLFHILSYVTTRIKSKSTSSISQMAENKNRGYFIYALFLGLNFFNSVNIDYSNPYGLEQPLRVVFWMLLGHLVFSWILGQWQLIRQLSNERTSAELAHLKSQVNPHFLFNTLNNLYGLALEKSDQTPGLILKLSSMLRYTIYQGKKDLVKLSEEIEYLNDFIQLQQVRYHKKVNIQFNQHLDSSDCQISPLLLIMLLENAYKHGVEKLTSAAYVKIDLQVKDGLLMFNIENNFDIDEVSGETGIGLANLQRRLSLVYPDKHQLNISQHDNVYQVSLELQLNQSLQN